TLPIPTTARCNCLRHRLQSVRRNDGKGTTHVAFAPSYCCTIVLMRLPGLFRRPRSSIPLALKFVCALLTLSACSFMVIAATARIAGTVYTVDSNHVQTVWP